MANPMVWLGVLALGTAGLLVGSYGAGGLAVWQRLQSTPSAAAYEISPGPIELDGRAAIFRKSLSAPFADDVRTLGYEYRIERYEGDDTGWRTIDSGSKFVPFVVTVDGLEVVVDPAGADFLLSDDARVELDRDEAPSGALAEFVADNDGVEGDGTDLSGSRYRFTVGRLDPGEQVYVTGRLVGSYDADLRTDSQQYVIEQSERSLTERLRSPAPFLITDAGEALALRQVRSKALTALGIGGALVAVAIAILALA